MKNPLDYISDLWEWIWFDEDVLFDGEGLTVLVFTQRFTKQRTVSIVSAVPGRDFSVLCQAYEVENVSKDGWAHLLRILDDTPTYGHLIVWLWHQGVSEPTETWTEEMA